MGTTGVVVLAGAAAGAGRVPGGTRRVVLATAAAFEHPSRHVAALVDVVGELMELPVLRRTDANDAANAAAIDDADIVYLLGPNPMHQRSTLQATSVFEALGRLTARGATVVGVGWAGAGLCDPTVDPRGGGLGLGLGLVSGVAMIPEAEALDRAHVNRTVRLAGADVLVLAVDSDSAAVFDGETWRAAGSVIAFRSGREVALDVYTG